MGDAPRLSDSEDPPGWSLGPPEMPPGRGMIVDQRSGGGQLSNLTVARAIGDRSNTEPAESRSVRPAMVRVASASSHPSQRATADKLDTAAAARRTTCWPADT